ncbi:MAG: carbohydrate ABC transporter permease [Clostridiaceae bacterium]|jgi:raffinose/stachyose/melibiose transport system permease protein|nr:carbohydrate ABC transporter permease [Clostridiaceae bacterium]
MALDKNSYVIGEGKHPIRKILTYILMIFSAAFFAAPVLIIANYSFKTKKELYLSNPLALPESFYIDNYVTAYKKLDLLTTFGNTLFYTVISVTILAMLCGAAAWAIARCKKKIFKFFYVYFLVGILIPYQALFLSIYIVGFRTGLTNTRLGVILMYIATGMSFGVFLMNSFMATVPIELEEAARIDGCSIYRTYFSIVLPLLKPSIATLIIMQAFQIWNDYLMASLFVSKKELKTLTVSMQALFSQQTSDYTTAMAAIVISILPMIILFASLQKYFIKGMTVGAVKG